MKKIVSFILTMILVFAMAPAVFAEWKENANGDRWYVDANGAKYQGLKKIDGKYYYFSRTHRNHYIETGFTVVTSDGKKSVYYFAEDGSMVFNKWVEEDGYKCYFGSNGKAVTGWKKFGEKYYYFGNRIIENHPERGVAAASGKRIIGTKLYTFNDDNTLSDKPTVDVGQIPIKALAAFDPYEADGSVASAAALTEWAVTLDDSKDDLYLETDSYKTHGDEVLYAGKYSVTYSKYALNLNYGYTDDKLTSVYLTRKCTDSTQGIVAYTKISEIITAGFGHTALADADNENVACAALSSSKSKEIQTGVSITHQIWTTGDTAIRMDLLESKSKQYYIQIRFYDNSK